MLENPTNFDRKMLENHTPKTKKTEIEKQNEYWLTKKPRKPAYKTQAVNWGYKTRFSKNIDGF